MSVYLFDSNVWVAATFSRHEFYPVAQQFLETLSKASPAVFCRATEQSFLRLATTSSLLARYDQPLGTNRDALAGLKLLLLRPDVRYRDEPPGTVPLWHEIASVDTASPKVWMNAYLAAFSDFRS